MDVTQEDMKCSIKEQMERWVWSTSVETGPEELQPGYWDGMEECHTCYQWAACVLTKVQEAAWKCFESSPFGLGCESTALRAPLHPPANPTYPTYPTYPTHVCYSLLQDELSVAGRKENSAKANTSLPPSPISSDTHSRAINKLAVCPLRSAGALQSSASSHSTQRRSWRPNSLLSIVMLKERRRLEQSMETTPPGSWSDQVTDCRQSVRNQKTRSTCLQPC